MVGTRKIQGVPGTSCWAKKQGNAQRMTGTCQKGTGSTQDPSAKAGTI